jgi:glycosyltransferase involved in cell wall biosynthesis
MFKFLKRLKLKKSNRLFIILDDYFPNLLTGFRISEYNYYLGYFDNARVLSSDRYFKRHLREYTRIYPQYRKRVKTLTKPLENPASLAYTVFITNIYDFLPVIEKHHIPFVFTLYPGGGFHLYEDNSDNKLRTVFSSPMFRKVIATQRVTYNYLINNQFCNKDRVKYIYGGVLPSDYFSEHTFPKKYYQNDKDTFDICFVARKYMKGGVDKGYDTFIAVCKMLGQLIPSIRFHVVGNFTDADIEVHSIRDKIKFYELRYKEFFPGFYARMDIILSPNIPFQLIPGGFDGFPTGSCVEAGFCGVAVFCTDELGLNTEFVNHHDICIIPRNSQDICDIVLHYYRNLDDLYQLSENCRKSFLSIFNIDRQMSARIKIIEKYLRKDAPQGK